jgi:heavy metal sensor kinase
VALPIRVRLTIWYCAVLALTLFLTGTLVVLEVRVNLRNGIDRELSLAASEIRMGYHATEGDSESDFRQVTDESSLGGLPRTGFAAQVVTTSGKVLVQTGVPLGARPLADRLTMARALAGRPAVAAASLSGVTYRVLVISFRKGGDSQALVVATSLAPAGRAIRKLIAALLVAGAASLVLAAGSGWWLARRALRPVARMTEQAGLIGAGGVLSERIQVPKAADELGRLAQTLNRTLARLEHAVSQQRRFVANASHELRTPLTVMRSEIDVSLTSDTLSKDARIVLESTREEVARMSALVENLLTLARIDEGELHLLRRPCDLRQIAEATTRELRPIAEQRKVLLRVSGSRGTVDADPDRIEQVVRNLLDNAIRYSPQGGTVALTVETRNGHAELAVRDEGPGIDPSEMEHVFERFYRGEPSPLSAGQRSGLGLAICQEITQAHGGKITATSQAGQGSTFRLTLPVRQTR